jgi:hypothetical protein
MATLYGLGSCKAAAKTDLGPVDSGCGLCRRAAQILHSTVFDISLASCARMNVTKDVAYRSNDIRHVYSCSLREGLLASWLLH